MEDPTSLKGMFQGLQTPSMDVLEGKVIQASPLKIQIIGDEKNIINANTICVPEYLTDHSITADMLLDKGGISSVTVTGEGTHPHGSSGQHGGHTGGDGSHSHPNSEGAHVHHLSTFTITGGTVKLYNSLKVGDVVYILSFNYGKRYYIMSRKVA